jgi:hypothetical protein
MIAKGVIMPLHAGQDQKPVAVVRIERIVKEYQRHGFFRIGLLPQVVAEGLTLELREGSRATEILGELPFCLLKVISRGAAPVRGFTIRTPNQSIPLLQAAYLSLGAGEWRLRDGTLARPGVAPIRFTEATLQVTGPAAGRICCRSVGTPIAFNLFASEPPNPQTAPQCSP